MNWTNQSRFNRHKIRLFKSWEARRRSKPMSLHLGRKVNERLLLCSLSCLMITLRRVKILNRGRNSLVRTLIGCCRRNAWFTKLKPLINFNCELNLKGQSNKSSQNGDSCRASKRWGFGGLMSDIWMKSRLLLRRLEPALIGVKSKSFGMKLLPCVFSFPSTCIATG